MLVLLAAASLAPGPLPEDSNWVRFSRTGALSHRAEMVRVGTVPDRRDTDHVYWFERQVTIPGRRRSVAWTDTRSCPAARAGLVQLGALTPRFDSLGDEDVLDVVADGATYALEAPVADGNGNMRIETTSNGPVRAWVDAMLAALEPCWTDSRPALSRPR
jgi:hypothetical protein